MEKILGLDLGSRTCGVAISDTLGMLAHGVETYHFSENAYMNGDLGERAQISIDFKERLEKMMDVEVILEDERLTTVIATNNLIFGDVSRKKRKQVVDKMAAVEILQGYLDKIRR